MRLKANILATGEKLCDPRLFFFIPILYYLLLVSCFVLI